MSLRREGFFTRTQVHTSPNVGPLHPSEEMKKPTRTDSATTGHQSTHTISLRQWTSNQALTPKPKPKPKPNPSPVSHPPKYPSVSVHRINPPYQSTVPVPVPPNHPLALITSRTQQLIPSPTLPNPSASPTTALAPPPAPLVNPPHRTPIHQSTTPSLPLPLPLQLQAQLQHHHLNP